MRSGRRAGVGDLTGLPLLRCEGCGRGSFPPRELCPHCGGRSFAVELAERGIAAEVTSHRGADIVCVRIGDAVTLLARAESKVAPGSEVTLRVDSGAPVAEVS